MIGRTEPVRPFALIRWARSQARRHGLRPLEAHVLLLLATYANDQAEAWPSIGTLARDAGLRVNVTGRGEKNSSISAALARLETLGLIWRRQAGLGHPARSELLFDPNHADAQPSATPEGKPPAASPPVDRTQPSATQEGKPSGRPGGFEAQPPGVSPPVCRTQPSATQEGNDQRNGHTAERPHGNTKRPDEALRQAGGLHPSGDQDPATAGERERIRALIRGSLDDAADLATRAASSPADADLLARAELLEHRHADIAGGER